METKRIKLKAVEASGRRRGWFKHVKDVDTSKTNGYAFEGDFLPSGKEIDLEVGSIIIEQRPEGSVKRSYNSGYAYKLTEDGLEEFASVDDWRQGFLSFRDAVAAALESAESKKDLLQARKAALEAELAEIEAELGKM